MLSRDLLNSSKFSRFESQNTEKRRIIIKNTGNKVIKDNDRKIISKYTARKTKDLNKRLKNFVFNTALFIHDSTEDSINFKRASSNIPNLTLLSDKGINVKDLIMFEKIFIEKNSLQKISKRLL